MRNITFLSVSTFSNSKELPATTGATVADASSNSDNDEPMTLDDGTLSSDDPGVFFLKIRRNCSQLAFKK